MSEKINYDGFDNVNNDSYPATVVVNEPIAEKKSRKIKGAIKPKRVSNNNDPFYALLDDKGKYREVLEDGLTDAAASVLKDTSLRLVKVTLLVPKISFEEVE